MRHLALLLLLALAALSLTAPASGPALALDADEMFDDPDQEARAREIGRQLRCLMCRNQSIFDSNAGIAKDLRVVVRERMAAGESDAEILTYVADRFGDYVLLEPRVTAQTYLLWAAPLAFLALGFFGLRSYHRGRGEKPVATPLTEEERAEARRILDGGRS